MNFVYDHEHGDYYLKLILYKITEKVSLTSLLHFKLGHLSIVGGKRFKYADAGII